MLTTAEPPSRGRSAGALDWRRDGPTWPNGAASRFVEAGGLNWHVQVLGTGPVALLLHGTGASTHSWRGLAPRLASRLTLVAPDLPGHGFTERPRPSGMSLPGMARLVGALVQAMDIRPALAIGHSAGAAILIRMVADGLVSPAGVVGLNAALLPIGGPVGPLFSPLAKLLVRSSLVPRVFAWYAADRAVVERLLGQTGSGLDREGLALYARLARDPRHMESALTMMARWDLASFQRDLDRLAVPLALVVGGKDGMVPPSDAFEVKDRLPGTAVDYLRGLGHLAHEEAPEAVASAILQHAGRWNVLTD